ncbi:MAG: family 43 glycosylhydrolase, partial [Gemmatimonadota bacterium]|nr:family 43 glycosylhydrolase [Gemmatimonadota bacterium]
DYGCFRPHVAYNPSTRKYVLWINGYGVPINFQVFEFDSPVGPFVERGRPDLAYNNTPGWGVNFGDENLFVDEDGSGYLVYSDWTTGGDIVIEKLDSTFLTTSGTYVKLGLKRVEAPSMFKRGSRYYITLSDPNCGYCTTGTSYITASRPLGPWSAPKKLTTTSCGGQPGHVSELPAAGGGRWYLFQSDLWISREANQAAAPQFWAPLSFDASGEIEPITCRSSYYVPALVTRPPSAEAEHERYYRLRCDIGEAGRVQREWRFTAAGDRLRSVSLNTYQRGRPGEPLVIELREEGSAGRVLQRSEIPPARIAWSARRHTLPLDVAVRSGGRYALRLHSASAQGCYGFAYRDDLPSRPAESLLSSDGGSTWAAERGRSVKLDLSF